MNLRNKISLITGASAGIGAAIAEKFAEAGSDLILTARRKNILDDLSNTLKEKYNVDILTFENDVRDYKSVENLVNSLTGKWQSVDILVNNAGKARGLDTVQEGNLEDWEEMIDTNIKGLLYFSRLILPKMIEKNSGLVLNIASIAGRAAYPKGNVYCATKSAVRTLSESMVIDLNGTGVKVCNIDPGMVETEFSLVRFHGDSERAGNVYKQFKPLDAMDIADIALFVRIRWY